MTNVKGHCSPKVARSKMEERSWEVGGEEEEEENPAAAQKKGAFEGGH